ncbi:GNAT family N-acetyltransferase [Vitiosangium sp. GDMCC 1.1324]|uniref:GNAT family N-acetyltransferase n=1 Tax=Vitiosangium sp. (strain GDMCC 1.1324) TaxID=2138576 RepID=UPI000D35B150|nr:GNAT family N-acetyltransferase [Vitiosangium sp. GDMCC 1.1324]PTL85823.1 N-acetyltransferase [Vitiosangium sp. GDMCC 1.1324]
MELVPFMNEHLDEASSLLALRHRAHRAAHPLLPAAPEEPAEARRILEALRKRPRTSGFAALQGGRLIGFALGTLRIDTTWGRSAWLFAPGHALAPGASPEVYRELYATLARQWVQAGCFAHVALLPASDRPAIEAWSNLGFGHEQVHALRSLDAVESPSGAPEQGMRLRRAGMEDLGRLLEVAGLVSEHQRESPVFAPYLPEFSEDWPQDYTELLQGEADRIWLAEQAGRLLGFAIFSPAERTADDLLTPPESVSFTVGVTREEFRRRGIGRALFACGLEEARHMGFRSCITDWRSTNLTASRAWPRLGFIPALYRMTRRLDERVAWARGHFGTID